MSALYYAREWQSGALPGEPAPAAPAAFAFGLRDGVRVPDGREGVIIFRLGDPAAARPYCVSFEQEGVDDLWCSEAELLLCGSCEQPLDYSGPAIRCPTCALIIASD